MDTFRTCLPARGILAVSGEDRTAFLQGLVSNDVARLAPGSAQWAALLTPQGKYLFDFFLVADGEAILIDAEKALIEDLRRKLSVYRLRSRVVLTPRPELSVWVGTDAPPPGAVADPRLAEAGWRALRDTPLADASGTPDDYDRHRLALGLPDGRRDMVPDKSVLLECGFDELGGVDWKKGCWMGQELTARTKYRGLIKKRLLPVEIDGPAPAAGTVLQREGQEIGEMRSANSGRGLALIRLDRPWAEGPIEAGEARLSVRPPAWLRLAPG